MLSNSTIYAQTTTDPMDGGWSIWSWTPCDKGCGGSGKRYKIRTCTNPIPQNGGQECTRRDGTQTTPDNRVEVDNTANYGSGYFLCNKQACTGPEDTTPPSQPQHVRATVISDTKIHLSWDPSADNVAVVKYRVYNNDTGFVIGDPGTAEEKFFLPDNYILNEFTVALLKPQTMYTFTVTALDEYGNESEHSAPVQATTLPFQKGNTVINPYTDISYLGAFRLPGPSGDSRWGYGGYGLTYYPQGEPQGPDDGYPGSLFGFGYLKQMYVSEIGIPEPVISPTKNINDLNTATTLQPFSKVDNFDHPGLTLPVGDIAYLPKQGNQQRDKLYYVWGSNYHWGDKIPTHSASELTLSTPDSQGWWYLGSANGDPRYYGIIFYLFDIPKEWADRYASGKMLVTGGTRSSKRNGFGNALYALAPWEDGNPFPPYEGELSYKTLLEYGQVIGVNTQDGREVRDQWHGGAWVTSKGKSAVIFVGNKGYGETTYDGTYIVSLYRPSFLFYDPADLAAVANGTMEPHEPQPYAIIDVGGYLFRDEPEIRSCAYDRQNGLLYAYEYNKEAPIIHVWKIGEGDSAQYTLSVAKTGNGNGTITTSPNGINCGDTCSTDFSAGTLVTLAATPDTGSAFAGWSGVCNGTGLTCQVIMDQVRNITAIFTENSPPSSSTCAPLNITIGEVINVSNVSELVNAINNSNASGGNRTILIADGTYELNSFLWLDGEGIVIRSASGNKDNVIIKGQGMGGNVSHIFNIDASNVTIADITLGEVSQHAIQIHGENARNNLTVHNVRFYDTGQQMLKASYDGGRGSDNGLVECSLFEYPAGIGPQDYIGGIDVHKGANWVVRDNEFRFIKSPGSSLAEHAIHFWSDSENTIVERNKIIDCDRGIGFGLGDHGHIGGIIRNNTVYTTRDVGIGLESSPNTKVYNNTVYSENYFDSIEYRWPATTGVEIKNNLTNLPIENRDGASGSVQNNISNALSNWFVDVTMGDLHLSSAITSVIDQGMTLAEVTDDIDKEGRPNGGGYDLGADEYGSTPVKYYLLNITKDGPGVVTSSPSGIDCGNICSAEFEENATVTLTATPDSGTAFVGWSGGECRGTDSCTITMNAAKSIIATFLFDADGDGVPEDADNCPDTPNPNQSDVDGDGVGDVCDDCPADPNKVEPGVCGCGMPDTDSDNDGTPDCTDGCPADPNKVEPGGCGCGVPDTDSDNDGTPDCTDGCPADPDNDSDLDGVCGDVDNCPAILNPTQTDSDGDGLGDLCDACSKDPANDSDGDGICGDLDNCPKTPNPSQIDADGDGEGDACEEPVGDVSISKEQELEFDRGGNLSMPFVHPGDMISYSITATNLFNMASTLMISDALSALVDYVKGSLKINGDTVDDESLYFDGNLLEYTSDPLFTNQSLTISFDVLVKEDALYEAYIENFAMVTAYPLTSDIPLVCGKMSNVVQVQVKEPVPEPATIALFGIGLSGLFVLMKRKRGK